MSNKGFALRRQSEGNVRVRISKLPFGNYNSFNLFALFLYHGSEEFSFDNCSIFTIPERKVSSLLSNSELFSKLD